MDIYDKNAPSLVEQGYHPVVTSPPDFRPAKAPVRWVPGLNKFLLLPGWSTRPTPILTPQPGANIGVRCGGGLVAFDYDDETAALAISEVFPTSPVNKAGQRAWTPFYRTDFDVPSEDFFDADGKKVLQILSAGRQAVIPPSIHPDTKEPYRWTNGRSLYDTSLGELPAFPRDYRERILALGYGAKRAPRPERFDHETGEIDNPWSELNARALKNLTAWVPDLNLHRCQRQRGRFPSYRAIATWRESVTAGKLLSSAPLTFLFAVRASRISAMTAVIRRSI